ncbi:Protein of unknown function [Actinokineospora alba]|uniref:DUF2567 domain-containing protein n=1 Tax=Actinokineospora alba TaxID=504798 RepID=A0A1H0MT95_9PSEU|nr:DUF2567 domain-containing protein [Actinokineospora alba]TDP68426.1 uncharacterized protein DUF2567 [Actinokineospora alba]SDH78858.1 Protein of unknown function [Actinokineospora alba]SDO83678.1 Protein of unknown function [Actinokineospora alba]
MTEQPVETGQHVDSDGSTVRTEPSVPGPEFPMWHRPAPRVVVKADLLPAISILSFVSLFGMAVGWLWSRLAPAQLVIVGEAGKLFNVRGESLHRFHDLVLFVLLGLGAGIVTGAGVWMLRERRGPVVMLAAVIGSAVAAWLAAQVGVSWAEARYVVTGAPKIGDVVAVAPRLESLWTVIAWPLGTAMAYGLAAAWNGHDDLGRRLG